MLIRAAIRGPQR